MMNSERRQRAYDLTDGRCIYCDARLADDENDVEPPGWNGCGAKDGFRFLCVTLRKPKGAGGRAVAANEVPACSQCSSLKGARTHEAFMEILDERTAATRRVEEDVPARPEIGLWQQVYDALPGDLLRNPGNPPLPPTRRRHGEPRRLAVATRS